MRLPLPGPADLLALVGGLRDAVGAALDLVPRMTVLLDQADGLLARVDGVVAAIEETVVGAQAAVAATQATVLAAERTVQASARAAEEVSAVVGKSAATQRRADDAVAGAQGLVNRVDPLLTSYEGSLRSLAPVLATFAGSTSEEEVSAAVSLVDRLPRLIAHVDDDVLPLLTRLDQVGPDLHELLEVTQDLRRVITGLPGVGFLRRRGDDEYPSEQPPD